MLAIKLINECGFTYWNSQEKNFVRSEYKATKFLCIEDANKEITNLLEINPFLFKNFSFMISSLKCDLDEF